MTDHSVHMSSTADVLGDLVASSLGNDVEAASLLVMALRRHGLSPETILVELFEPAARCFGDLWQDDRCSEFDITVALGRLQSLTRQLGDDLRYSSETPTHRRSVLVATMPRRSHMLALTLSSEYFWHAGWEVTCAFPESDAELCSLLRTHRFDVLDLSLSSVFREEDRLKSMATSVQAARMASAEASLIVLASGRVFVESPELSLLVGADAGCTSAARVVALAERLVHALGAPGYSSVRNTLLNVGEEVATKAFSHLSDDAGRQSRQPRDDQRELRS